MLINALLALLTMCRAQNLLEEIPITRGVEAGCDLTISGILVLNCPSENQIYSTHNAIKYGLKGVANHGSNYRLTAVHNIVEQTFQGHVAVIDPVLNAGVKLFDTGADIDSNRDEVYPFKLFTYQFIDTITDFILYDTDYVVLVLNSNKLAYIVITGLPKLNINEKYLDRDLMGMQQLGNNIEIIHGYGSTINEIYNYYFLTVEKDQNGISYLKQYKFDSTTGF